MANISISHREWIRWLPDRASEPTTTLVLTSPEKRFVDVRILKPQTAPETNGDGNEEEEDLLPTSRLDWAFAGNSTSETRHTDDGKAYTHSAWHHWVSSRVVDAEKITDEGDMFDQADGTVLEKGSMINPDTGEMGDYEELWSDEVATATTANIPTYLTSSISSSPFSSNTEITDPDESHKDDMAKCVVLVLQNDEHVERGMVIRAGQWCQGVMRVGEYFSAERWKWESQSGWRRLKRVGDGFLPCGAAIDGSEHGRLRLGGEVTFREHVWKVVEMSEHAVS